MTTYHIVGRIHPERAAVSIPQSVHQLYLTNGGKFGQLTIEVSFSQISAFFETNIKLSPETLRNSVQPRIEAIVDAFGFLIGCAYSVEISSISEPNNADSMVLGVGMDCVAKIYTTEEVSKKLGRLLNLSQEKEGIYFSRCLADLRNSLRAPFDTPFYCFRAIECLRQAFCIQFQLYPEKQRAESWNALRKELGITRDLISENIQKYAMPNRHGYIEEFSEEQRAKILETTWGIVDRYIEYSNKNNDD